MKALILSAGKGTRVSGITKDEIPKVMLPIAGKPVLQWHVEHLKRHGIEEILINLHCKPESIQGYFGDGSRFGVRIRYNFEPSLMGTAGALHGFRREIDGSLVVFYGDVMNELDLSKLADFHKENSSVATIVVHDTDHPHDSDIVEICGDARVRDMRIKMLHHKPGSSKFGNLGNAGCYIVEPDVLEHLLQGPCDFIKDVFPRMLAVGKRLFAYETSEFLKDMGTPERYAIVNARYERLRDSGTSSVSLDGRV